MPYPHSITIDKAVVSDLPGEKRRQYPVVGIPGVPDLYVCCFEAIYTADVFPLVEQLYAEYQLGTPKLPALAMWVHVIPVHTVDLTKDAILFAHQIGMAVYWGLYYTHLKKKGRERRN